jgi:hypothetical protein
VPEGASVYVDGRLVIGETPTSVEVSDDDFHDLRIEKDGYQAGAAAVGPEDREPLVTVSLVPEKQPRGVVFVDANGGGEVWLDGVDTGYATPTLGLRVATGSHVVEVRNGQSTARAKVEVAQGQTVHLLLGPTGATGGAHP